MFSKQLRFILGELLAISVVSHADYVYKLCLQFMFANYVCKLIFLQGRMHDQVGTKQNTQAGEGEGGAYPISPFSEPLLFSISLRWINYKYEGQILRDLFRRSINIDFL